jgi:hypothetical protein
MTLPHHLNIGWYNTEDKNKIPNVEIKPRSTGFSLVLSKGGKMIENVYSDEEARFLIREEAALNGAIKGVASRLQQKLL